MNNLDNSKNHSEIEFPAPSRRKVERCPLEDCNKKLTLSDTISKCYCERHYCPQHRLPEEHKCPALKKKKDEELKELAKRLPKVEALKIDPI